MNLLIIRHAIAMEREDWNHYGYPDELRPLTDEGVRKFHLVAKKLRTIIPNIDFIYHSELLRAFHTAELLYQNYSQAKMTELSMLNPDENFFSISKLLSQFKGEQTIALIGHMPDLAKLTGFFLSTKREEILHYKKGGVALLKGTPDRFTLHWHLTPKQLIAMNNNTVL